MSVTASMVKDLRERTGAGMMDCKTALVETGGDMDAAVELLRESGQAKADKKSGRIAADGRIVVALDERRAVIAEVNSETDFVAKDENFIAFAEAVAAAALAGHAKDVEALLSDTLADGQRVEAARTELVSKVGENISVRRFVRIDADDRLGTYTHGARIGAVVAMSGGDAQLAKDMAMHVAATRPLCIDEAGVPSDTLENERRVIQAQAEESGKSPEIVARIVAGRVDKFLKEITLLGQPFVRDPDLSVGRLLDEAGAKVTEFVRFEVGEGIEKREQDFAQEVLSQIRQSG
ncbi:MAG: translation elongation factor Ts [Woeseia sp.]